MLPHPSRGNHPQPRPKPAKNHQLPIRQRRQTHPRAHPADPTTTQTLTIAYQHDKVGNRTARTVTGAIQQTTTYQYDQNDRLTQSSDSLEGTTSYRYDLRGNLTEKANGNNTTKYSYNSDNRLIKVEHSNSGTITKTTTYGYDPQGRRIKKLVQQGASKTETHYSLDSERPYHEVAVESTRVNTQPWTHKTYVHTPGGVGELISQSDGATTKQIYADAQGTTRLIADSTTGASQSYSFDAFGNWLAGDGIGASQNPPTHLYTGERFDADTGLIYLRARDYDPAIGRFISMDEHPGNQRIPLTLNKYLYANADPVNHVDPSGNFGIVSVGMGGNIQASLGNLQASFGFDLISNALDGGQSMSASSTGWAVLVSMAPFSVAKLSKGAIKIHSKIGSKGKVAYSARKRPLDKEIDAAEFLSENRGVGIYIRGGRSAEGADFFMSGVRWELKTLESPSNNAVYKNIKKAMTQSENIIIDGRKVDLSYIEAMKGIERASRNGHNPSKIILLLKDGVIKEFP